MNHLIRTLCSFSVIIKKKASALEVVIGSKCYQTQQRKLLANEDITYNL